MFGCFSGLCKAAGRLGVLYRYLGGHLNDFPHDEHSEWGAHETITSISRIYILPSALKRSEGLRMGVEVFHHLKAVGRKTL
jgi:enolase